MNQINAPGHLPLSPEEIHVWILDIHSCRFVKSTWEPFLLDDERKKAAQYKFEDDRFRFAARRGMLRNLIAHYTDLVFPEIIYKVNPSGKIYLPDHPLRFSISSSQNKIALAFVIGKEIGVDIEKVNPLPDLFLLMKRWFSKKEKLFFSRLPNESKLGAFYHVWTQKEAFIKAKGEGLGILLNDFSVSVDPCSPAELLEFKNGEPSYWQLESVNAGTSWKVAVCVQSNSKLPIRVFNNLPSKNRKRSE